MATSAAVAGITEASATGMTDAFGKKITEASVKKMTEARAKATIITKIEGGRNRVKAGGEGMTGSSAGDLYQWV
jgi:hypothetical protein